MARVWLIAEFVTSIKDDSRVVLHGKFFHRLGRKFFLKAMRLPDVGDALDFNQKLAMRKRFDDLSRAHTTGLILTEPQAMPCMGIAAQAGLQAMVEFTVTADELIHDATARAMTSRIIHLANLLRPYPALMGYLIDCRVAADDLRHRGLDQLRKRLTRLLAGLRRADRDRIVALKHRPATVGLFSLAEDLIYAEMPALSPAELSAYVVRLHNLAEARPVVLEFGEGLAAQDELMASAFGLGVAGVVAPPLRPAAPPAWLGIRMLSGAELLPFVSLNGSCPPPPPVTPMVSVVICAYNAERTMRACLESLRAIDYPNYEVVVVDDGSYDATAAIAADFPEFRLIRQRNKGLSVARNVGMQAALGELIAYTDSDCVVDPHWLTLIVRAMSANGFDGCGGPNYAPHEEGWVEASVAASPGAPCHVLTSDDRAEHLAGCNMVFRKAALLALGGFDPQFTAAGDDVDFCWRMLDAGMSVGFCPAAFVWHFRRSTIKAYYGQQRGYGKAEAMLFLKYPERFNALGQIRWRGTIPGLARTFPGGGSRVGWARRKRDLQRVSDAPLSILKVLPLTAEWNAASLMALVLSLGFRVSVLPALLMLAVGVLWAFYYAANAPLERCHRSLRARALIAWLAYTGPISRTIARYRYRRNSRGRDALETRPRQRPTIQWLRRTMRLAYWNEVWTTRESLLEHIGRLHAKVGRPALPETGWSDADLVIEPGALTRVEIKTADEEHSGNRMKNHVAIRTRLTPIARAVIGLGAIGAIATAGFGLYLEACALAAAVFSVSVCAAAEGIETVRLAYRVVEQSASELGLTPLGQPTLAAARAAQPARVRPSEADREAVIAQPAGR